MPSRRAVVAVLVLLAVGGVVVVTQTGGPGVQRPTFGVADYGDWGAVRDDGIEIVHTFWVRNPNPAGVDLGDAVTVRYQATVNDVGLAEGEASDPAISNGNNTIEATTLLRTDRIVPWWLNFVENDETISYVLRSEADVGAGLSYRTQLPERRGRALTNSTPVEDALDRTASGLEGRYACTVGDDCLGASTPSPSPDAVPGATVGVRVVNGSAEWGEVTREATVVRFRFRVRNVGDVALALDARHLGASVALNDVELLGVTREDHAVRGVDGDAVLAPGDTRTITYVVRMDNERVDEWLRSHVRRDERSRVRTQLQLVLGAPTTDLAVRLPADGGVRYECSVRTAILEDGQTTATTCGSGGSVGVGPVDVGVDGDGGANGGSGTATPTPMPTSTATPTADDPPTAVASATPTSGTAPLTTTFDATGSSDPDGDIRRYVWRFDDGSPPARGATVDHTFRTPGRYEASVTVIDAAGNRDTATVTVDVDRPLG